MGNEVAGTHLWNGGCGALADHPASAPTTAT